MASVDGGGVPDSLGQHIGAGAPLKRPLPPLRRLAQAWPERLCQQQHFRASYLRSRRSHVTQRARWCSRQTPQQRSRQLVQRLCFGMWQFSVAVPGTSLITAQEQRFMHVGRQLRDTDIPYVQEELSSRYMPHDIINGVQGELRLNSEFRKQYIDWWVKRMPPLQTTPLIEAASKKVGEMEGQKKSKDEIGNELQTLLGVPYKIFHSHEELVAEARKQKKMTPEALDKLVKGYDEKLAALDKAQRAASMKPGMMAAARNERAAGFKLLEKEFEKAIGIPQVVEKTAAEMIAECRHSQYIDQVVRDPKTGAFYEAGIVDCLRSLEVLK